MVNGHAVLCGVEEVVEEILMPMVGVGYGEETQTRCEEIHVGESHLSPGVERWFEFEFCRAMLEEEE